MSYDFVATIQAHLQADKFNEQMKSLLNREWKVNVQLNNKDALKQINEIEKKLQEITKEDSQSTLNLELNIDTNQITTDIRNAVKNIAAYLNDDINIHLNVDKEELLTNLRAAIKSITNDIQAIELDININQQNLQKQRY